MSPLLDDDIRSSLHAWAAQAPVPTDRLHELADAPVRRSRPTRLLAAAVLIVVTLIAVALNVPRRDDTDAVAGRPGVEARIAVGRAPGIRSLAADDTWLWATSANDGVLERIDPRTNDVTASYDVGRGFEGIAVGDGLVWLTGYGSPNRIVAIDADTGAIVHDIPVEFDPWGIELAFGAAWAGGDGELHRIDTATGGTTSYRVGRSAGFVTATATSLWVANPDDTSITELDPDTGRVLQVARLGEHPRSIAVDPSGHLWVTSFERDALLHVDAESGDVIGRIVVGQAPMSLAVVGDDVWTTTFRQGTVVRVDTRTEEVVGRYPVGNRPSSIESAFGSVWVALNQESAVLRLDPGGALRTAAAPWFDDRVAVEGDADGAVYVRCSGRGTPTLVLVQDVWHDTGALSVLEAKLAEHASVCIAEHADVSGPDQDDALRATLRGAGVTGPVVVVAHGAAGVIGRHLAASWPDVAGLVLLDTNTESPMTRDEIRDSRYLASIHGMFAAIDDLAITVPVLVATADPDAPADPRNGDASTRARFHENQLALAERLDAELVVIDGDPWPPTHRPNELVEVLLAFAARVTAP
ncbi:MAG TPA: hypothetical protein VFU93_15505 [Acidimicrobiales bacterium]|nr:hypothetical protein [Acidimicrobiales bacterium]